MPCGWWIGRSSKGHRVVIATNPFFPLKAVQHRLRWAGLPPEKYPFALVTSYETFHFTKEMVAYYPEDPGAIGLAGRPAGDGGRRYRTGSQTHPGCRISGLLGARSPVKRPQGWTEIPQGTLESFRGWLEKTDPETLKNSFQNSSGPPGQPAFHPGGHRHGLQVPPGGCLGPETSPCRMEPDRDPLSPAGCGA